MQFHWSKILLLTLIMKLYFNHSILLLAIVIYSMSHNIFTFYVMNSLLAIFFICLVRTWCRLLAYKNVLGKKIQES